MSKRPIVIIRGWSDGSASFTALRNYVASLDLGTPVINLADYASMDDTVRFDDLIDCSSLYRKIDGAKDALNISLSASPDIRVSGNVGYRTLSSNDIGPLRLSPKALRQIFVPHRTLLVEIKLRRERAPGVFRIKAV